MIRPQWSRRGVVIDVMHAAVSVVAKDDTTIEQLHHGVAGHDDVVAVTWPALAGYDRASPVSADDDAPVWG